ncbi:MAG: hypothetical protein COA74_13205 [Gammaproteobacteria bacterium]|nr:MAG: hypothetical protein COA74_13205 [Gammaproteobacteria bacterium]
MKKKQMLQPINYIKITKVTKYTSLKLSIMGLIVGLFLNACSQPADFYYVDGREGRLKDYNDKWLLINYWAEWCKPCIEEVPELNHFYQQYSDEYAILAVSFDSVESIVLMKQVEKYNMLYPLVASIPKPNLGIGMPTALPANYLRSPEGKIFGPLLGPQTLESLLAAFTNAKKSN